MDGERIAAVGEGLEADGAEVVDASGALVLPGGIDPHTHFDLPVGAVRSADDFESGTLAAACGGTTCVIDFAGAGREPPDEALRVWHAKADGRAVVDYGFHLTVTAFPEDPEEGREVFRRFAAEGVASVKLYMAYPERLMVDDDAIRRALAASVETGVRVCVHAEDGAEVERLVAAELAAGRTGPEALPAARPPEVEAAAVRRAAAMAADTGAWLYVVHLSSAAGLREVAAARARGADVHAETCPQYLELTADRLAGEDGPDHVCAPPIRTDADREALWEAVGGGDLEVVGTDHCPFTKADRRAGVGGEGWEDFSRIPGGFPGVETRLSLVYQGVRDGRLTLERWVDACSSAPARLFGLSHRKGAVAAGLDADLVLFDPGATRRLDPGSLHSRADHSPYADLEVMGWPALTLARGRKVAVDGEPADARPGWGRYRARRPAVR